MHHALLIGTLAITPTITPATPTTATTASPRTSVTRPAPVMEADHFDDPPAAADAFGLELVPDGVGVLASWLESDGDETAFRFARWTPAEDGVGTSGWSDAGTVVSRDDLFANWADRPAVRRLGDGSLLAHHLQHISDGTYAYGVRLSRSTDDGRTWTDHGWLHDDARAVEHGFVSMQPTPDGLVAVWLDGRAMPEQHAGDGHGHGGHGHGDGEMSIRVATLDDEQWSGVGTTAATSTLLDPRTCECCDTDLAWTASGPVVVYRDRGAAEERDIAIVRRVDGRWSTPSLVARDDWRIEGCPVNGPEIAAVGDRVIVAWFTASPGDGDEPRPPRVLVATSDDGGATFAPPQVVSESTLGRVDLAMLPGGDAVVAWVDLQASEDPEAPGGSARGDDGASGSIRLRRIARDGRCGPVRTIAPIDLGRRAGFPRIVVLPPNERTGGETALLIGWRDEAEPGIRTVVAEPPR